MRTLSTITAFTLLSRGIAAHACVTCDSATACQVRRGLFDAHFAHTLLITTAPVPVLLAAAMLIFYRFPLPAHQRGC